MNETQAIEIARAAGQQEGWPWLEPVIANQTTVFRFWFFGPSKRVWHVRTNAHGKGCNINIHIDDETGRVLSKIFLPR